ncbi:MAG TPA: alpha/beta family hydrolase [Chthoniobacterales bacterium]|nr:alpha/beta family hydrolase [Chthoniobacterales bacterium]
MIRPSFLFAPGAGAPSSHPWMQRWKDRLAINGDVTTFDYDYMREGLRRPDPLPLLIAAHRSALKQTRPPDGRPVFLIGKSMGGRIGCHVSLEENVAGVICLGYPLCGGGDPKKLRDKVLRALETPILFVQGTRDTLCPLDLLGEIVAGMKVATHLHVVEQGDHSLQVSKRHLAAVGQTQENFDDEIVRAIEKFVEVCGAKPGVV